MRVCLAGKEKIGDFAYKEDCDLIVFSFRGLSSVVSYEKEIGGETNYMEEIAVLSKGKKIVVCGGETDTLGVKRKSVIVAQNGKILGICDMLHSTKERDSAGTGMGIFDTELGRVGVIVGEDLYFPEVISTLSLCACAFVVCPFFGEYSDVEISLIRAYSFLYGLPILFCGGGYSSIADGGEILCMTPRSPIYYSLEIRREYCLVETRKPFRKEGKDKGF